jgi:hypothetical protein
MSRVLLCVRHCIWHRHIQDRHQLRFVMLQHKAFDQIKLTVTFFFQNNNYCLSNYYVTLHEAHFSLTNEYFLSQSQNFPHLMKPDRSWSFSHERVTPASFPCPKTNPLHNQVSHVQKINLFLSSRLPLGLGSGLSPSVLPIIVLCIFLFSTIPATCSTQLVFLGLLTLTMARSTNHDAPQYAILSSPLLFRSCWIQILSSTPIAWTPSVPVHLIRWKDKFYTSKRQQTELLFCVL